jgi:hypothetical protein
MRVTARRWKAANIGHGFDTLGDQKLDKVLDGESRVPHCPEMIRMFLHHGSHR